jgi:hypothetical protein
MKRLDHKPVTLKGDNQRLRDLRYSRAYTLSLEALHTLCCRRGNVRSRLQLIDAEYYSLRDTDLPDAGNLRSSFEKLLSLVTPMSPRWKGDGRIPATLAGAHYTALERAAQLVWEVHQEFSVYMQGDA